MLRIFILNVTYSTFMLSVAMLSVVMLSVIAPYSLGQSKYGHKGETTVEIFSVSKHASLFHQSLNNMFVNVLTLPT
jgi:hypothetical protein